MITVTTERAPAVAGMFYPGAPEALRNELATCLAAPSATMAALDRLKALIVPHAGYV